MILFRLIKDVLDELYDQLPISGEDVKDDAIIYELKVLRDKYPELTDGVSIDYSDRITRFAYIYRYVAAHAYTIYALIRSTPELGALFNMEETRVSCLGGGPGSDLLGILKYMERNKNSAILNFRVYDREERWRESLSSICNRLTSFAIVPTFRTIDFVDAEAWTKCPDLFESNLFTMSFFLSELYARQELAEDFFMSLFKNAQKYSWFLFVDNSSGYSRDWFDKLVKMHNQHGSDGRMQLIKKSEKHGFQLENCEQAKDLEPYYGKFGGSGRSKFDEIELPKSNPRVDYRIYRKL